LYGIGFEGDKAAVQFCSGAASQQCECSEAVWHWQGCGFCFIACWQMPPDQLSVSWLC